jgi:hypothetical protein
VYVFTYVCMHIYVCVYYRYSETIGAARSVWASPKEQDPDGHQSINAMNPDVGHERESVNAINPRLLAAALSAPSIPSPLLETGGQLEDALEALCPGITSTPAAALLAQLGLYIYIYIYIYIHSLYVCMYVCM